MILPPEQLKKIKEILSNAGIRIPAIENKILERDFSMKDIMDKKNIQLLELVLERSLTDKSFNPVKELERYGFKIISPEDFEILKKKNVYAPLWADYQHTIQYLCRGWDWEEIEPNLLHGSMCIWKKDNRYYYCEGFIDKNKNDVGVVCRRVL